MTMISNKGGVMTSNSLFAFIDKKQIKLSCRFKYWKLANTVFSKVNQRSPEIQIKIVFDTMVYRGLISTLIPRISLKGNYHHKTLTPYLLLQTLLMLSFTQKSG